jgi:hypothetical protein
MAAVVTLKTSGSSVVNKVTDGYYETASDSPTGGRRVWVAFHMRGGHETDPVVASGFSIDGSWTKVAEKLESWSSGTDQDGLYIYEAKAAATPGSGTITITNKGSSTAQNCGWVVVELPDGYNAGSTPGYDEVQAGNSLTCTITFDDSGSDAFGIAARLGTTTGPGTPSGWTLVVNIPAYETRTVNTSDIASNSSPTWSWGGGGDDAIGIGIEIKSAASPPTAGTDPTIAASSTEARTDIVFGDSPDNTATYIHRSTSQGFEPGPGTRHTGNIGANETSHTDTDTVSADTTYYYVVEWENASGSTYSAEVAIKTAPAKPTAYAFTPAATSIQFTITRAAGSTDDRHRTYISDSGGDPVTTVDFGVGDVTTTVYGLTSGETYTFDTQAYDPDINGGLGGYSTFYTDTQATSASDRSGIVTWAELETPSVGRRAIITWAEMGTPFYTRYDGVDAVDRMTVVDLGV